MSIYYLVGIVLVIRDELVYKVFVFEERIVLWVVNRYIGLIC